MRGRSVDRRLTTKPKCHSARRTAMHGCMVLREHIQMVMFGDLELEDGHLLYHYTRPARLAQILDGGVLRMGTFGQTNDPREAKQWLPSLSTASEPGSLGNEEFVDLLAELDCRLRLRAKLLCLTRDRVAPNEIGHHGRGWARARMWSQYAADQAGCCLILDADALRARVYDSAGDASVFEGEINYADRAVAGSDGVLTFPLELLRERGVEAVANEYIASHWNSLFFNKNTDWRSEEEFRFVILDDKSEHWIDIRDSLRGLVVGAEFPDTDLSVLSVRLERLGLDRVPVAHLSWQNGSPIALPDAQRLLPTDGALSRNSGGS